jgi:hypothetical protein
MKPNKPRSRAVAGLERKPAISIGPVTNNGDNRQIAEKFTQVEIIEYKSCNQTN